MTSVSGRASSGRAAPWGADAPVGEEQARERLLAAAEACYLERGPARTRMSDIANKAGVHRRTLYDYFPTKDALLAASFVRATSAVIDATGPLWNTDEPFLDRLVNATAVGLKAARSSPTMALLIGTDDLGRTFHAAEASEAWSQHLAQVLGQRLEVAQAAGEVRDDLAADTMAHWVTRIAFSLVAEPGRPEDGGDAGLLRAFLPACLAPRTR
ncbi:MULTISPECIES: TetR/AcrR family transcriptional regulator [Mycolicibacterium]|uniref:Helix-turn-helix domain-containing protein n=2 Tax=Mycolicibacterium TaxID=1866885 RepID=A0AAE4VKU6_MYCFO|nr:MULTISPECIES: TetR/AcrR family transcriptional regulator [Mycolicibacterium]MCV7142439.1 TetR/AcrR family transcriptional regulator [Mycolicibacterium fortuitum]MDV7195514.1 helix-turn-helix domain-containing protein [Mycolicibacterium fortuitum]MDV7209174.1 helix-turn-helix domain-containing protein [Mycolicibacterium fortuitum]MDV7231044.1 helix-turn-helix domain-containing protein [Mycolicibacterium fortuitum]MDV7262604.1 helix-turn-helix domain-containing protein [Mycolicibacterium fort